MSHTRDIDRIIHQIKGKYPEIEVIQLRQKHNADDNGIWWFFQQNTGREIQIENPFGNCPFLVETDERSSYQAQVATTIEEAIQAIVSYLLPQSS
jgi:hypothetical protein